VHEDPRGAGEAHDGGGQPLRRALREGEPRGHGGADRPPHPQALARAEAAEGALRGELQHRVKARHIHVAVWKRDELVVRCLEVGVECGFVFIIMFLDHGEEC
jgi:hypothetical protein